MLTRIAKLFFWNALAFCVSIIALILLVGQSHGAKAETVESLLDRTISAQTTPYIEDVDPPSSKTQDVWPPFTWSLFGGTSYNVDSSSDLISYTSGALANISQPRLDITASVNDPAPTQETQLIAVPSNFQSLYLNMYFNWCVGYTKSTQTYMGKMLAQNGVVAGGRMLPYVHDRSDCMTVTDRPVTADGDTDKNLNGMGDRWERRYGLYVDDPKTAQAIAQEDPDRDGFAITAANGYVSAFSNNNPLKVVPDSIAGITGDGKFTNYEEYIWGTSPVDGDTDDDGFGDEQDVSGLGQISFPFTFDPALKAGDKEFVELIGLGNTAMLDADTNGQRRLVKIVNVGREMYVGSGEALIADLDYTVQQAQSPDDKRPPRTDIYPNDTVEFRAAVENSVMREANLHYRWTMRLLDGGIDAAPEVVVPGGDPAPYPEKYNLADPRIGRNGFGLNPIQIDLTGTSPLQEVLKFPPSVHPKVGNVLELDLQVIEPDTQKVVEVKKKFPITTAFTIVPAINGTDIAVAPALVFNPCSADGKNVVMGGNALCIDANTAQSITMRVLGVESVQDNLLFEWFVDSKKVPNSKVGAAGNQVTFLAAKRSGNYDVRVDMYKIVDQALFTSVDTRLPVNGAPVTVTGCPAIGTAVPAGDFVTLEMQDDSIGTIPMPYQKVYRWRLNDAVQPYSDVPLPLTFATSGEGAHVGFETAIFLTGQTYHEDPNDPNSPIRDCGPNDSTVSCIEPISSSIAQCDFSVAPAGTVAGIVNRVNQNLASLPQLLPVVLQKIVLGVVVLGGVFGVLIYLSLGTFRIRRGGKK